jgi:hypothetical protein
MHTAKPGYLKSVYNAVLITASRLSEEPDKDNKSVSLREGHESSLTVFSPEAISISQGQWVI